MAKFALAQPVRRVEDPRLLKGEGRHTDDIALPRMLHGVVLRSPHAAAIIKAIDTAAAGSAPGGKAVYTATDLNADGIGSLPCAVGLSNRDGSAMASRPHPVLADGAVRHVGDPVAFIVAETAGLARDAAERIAVDYDIQPSITDLAKAGDPAAPLVWPDVKRNIVFDWEFGDRPKTDALFASAAHVTRLTVVNNRVVVASMEARAAIADFDSATGRWTLYANTQGGGFGMKLFLYAGTSVLASVYGFRSVYANVVGMFTNTVPVDAYRGAGRPESNYLMERLADAAARELTIDRMELRRRNMVPSSAMPHTTPYGTTCDSGNSCMVLDTALRRMDYAGFAPHKRLIRCTNS